MHLNSVNAHRGCSTSANSTSDNSTSASWPKSNWPKSKLAEVEINWPKSNRRCCLCFFFPSFFFFFSCFVFTFLTFYSSLSSFCFSSVKPQTLHPIFRWTLPLDPSSGELPSGEPPSGEPPSAGQPSAGPPKISRCFSLLRPLFFFFETAENKDVVTGQDNIHLANNLHLTKVAETTSCAEGASIPSSRDSLAFQERHGNAFVAAQARRQLPSTVPSSSDAPSEDPRFRTGLLAGQTPKENFRLFRPPPSNLARDHHHPHDRSCPGARDKSSLCVSVLLAGRCCLFGPRSVGGSRSLCKADTKVASKASWLPPTRDKPSATTSSLLRPLKNALGPSPNLARRCSCATAVSTANPCGSRPRLSNTLAIGVKQAARRRRRRTTRKGSESILETRWTGNAVNGTEASGPL